MPHPFSQDLRDCVVAFVASGNPCNEAARHFNTSISFAGNLMALYHTTGSIEPRACWTKNAWQARCRRGVFEGFSGAQARCGDARACGRIGEKGILVAPQSLPRWLIKQVFGFKKHLGQANKTGLNWHWTEPLCPSNIFADHTNCRWSHGPGWYRDFNWLSLIATYL